jgi:hypothetical protein
MRCPTALTCCILLFSVSASAQSTKPVEVTNFPEVQSVEVTNPPPADGARFQLVGFTTASFTGNLGGPFGANAKCQADFPGSRMCVISEAQATLEPPLVRPAAAWSNALASDSSLGSAEVHGGIRYYCTQWLVPDSRSGAVLRADGAASNALCSGSLPIACCAPVP